MGSEEYKPHSVDAMLSRIEAKLDASLQKQTDHETRLTALERWRYYLIGVFVAAGFGAKAIWEIFKQL